MCCWKHSTIYLYEDRFKEIESEEIIMIDMTSLVIIEAASLLGQIAGIVIGIVYFKHKDSKERRE
jgi:hypothetical protein